MSWNIQAVGDRQAVKARVAADTNIPQPIKDLVALFADVPKAEGRALSVTSFGHFGNDSYSNVGKLEINNIELLSPPTS